MGSEPALRTVAARDQVHVGLAQFAATHRVVLTLLEQAQKTLRTHSTVRTLPKSEYL